jgi:hypothetical protein
MSLESDDLDLLEMFHETLVATEGARPVADSEIASLTNRVPSAVIAFWKKHGWCSYQDGLIRIVNPKDYLELHADWQLDPDAFVFAVSAFGDLVCINDDALRVVFVHTATMINPKLRYSMALANQFFPDDVDDFFFGPLYREAVERFGRPAPDEIFTFEPALALGGQATLEHIARAKLKPALALLAQLVDELQEYT